MNSFVNKKGYKNQIWKKNISYKLKFIETEELEPSDMISLNEKGLINIKIKSLQEMRDFMLDGTEIELVERKKFFRTKEIKPSESVGCSCSTMPNNNSYNFSSWFWLT